MKITAFVIIASLLFISCKKNGTDPALLEVPYPHQWIFTVDASADKYIHMEAPGGIMLRSEILKSYPFSQLTLERYCEFNVAESRTEYTNELCYTIQCERRRNYWLFAGRSSNLQEVHMQTGRNNSEIEDPGGDGYRFFIHEMPKANGVRTVAIESVDNPGYYISTAPPGFNYSPTQLTLTQHSSPQAATHWQCRSAK